VKPLTPIIFVVGTGRCGTLTLSHVLGGAPQIFSLHEGRRKFMGDASVNYGDMMGLNCAVYNSRRGVQLREETQTVTGSAEKIMDASFKPRHDLIRDLNAQGRILCDVNRITYHFIPYVASRYPQAKFIHVIREGRSVVNSWMRRPGMYPDRRMLADSFVSKFRRRYLERKKNAEGVLDWLCDIRNYHILRQRAYDGGETDIISTLDKRNFHWEKPKPLTGDPFEKEWRHWTRFQRVAWYWNYVNQTIEASLSQIPEEQCYELRIEDLNNESAPELFDFLEVPYPKIPVEIKRYNSNQAAKKEEWTTEMLEQCRPILGERMEKYGYNY